MRKGWLVILVIVYIVVFSSFTYSKLSESEKSRLEKCPLITYVNVTGDGVHKVECKDVQVEKGYDEIFFNLSCDVGKDSVIAYVNLEKNKLGGNAIKDRETSLWKLYNFRLDENPFLIKCIKNKTLLKDQEIWVYVRPSFEIEAEKTQKKIKENLEKQLNKTDVIINKTDIVIGITNQSKSIIDNINKTTTEINKTTVETGVAQKTQECKDKFSPLTLVLILLYELLLAVIGLIIGWKYKKNKKLIRKLIISLIFISFLGIIIIPLTEFIISLLCEAKFK